MNLSKCIEWSDGEVALNCRANVFDPVQKIFNPKQLARHSLFVGESGSGKTASGIVPTLASMVEYQSEEGFEYSMLVIDPKNELRSVLTDLTSSNSSRLFDVNKSEKKVDLFADFSELSFSEKYMMLFDLFDSSNDAGTNNQFKDGGVSLLKTFASADEVFYERYKISLFELWFISYELILHGDNDLLSQMVAPVSNEYINHEQMIKRIRVDFSRLGIPVPNYFGMVKRFVHAVRNSSCGSDDVEPMVLFLNLFALLGPKNKNMVENLGIYVRSGGISEEMKHQFIWYTGFFEFMLSTLSSGDFCRFIDVSPIPVKKGASSIRLSEFFDNGGIVLYTPNLRSEFVSDVLAKLIKTQFFSYTFKRACMNRPMAYVADEFHRFITADRDSGEHNFLDRCRSYRVSCVLATQSFESLLQKISEGTRVGVNPSHVVNVILNNIGNKLFFRTSCVETKNIVSSLIPVPDRVDALHVLSVIPLTGLNVGECYSILSSVKWGRYQVDISELSQYLKLSQESKVKLEVSPVDRKSLRI